MAVVDKYFMWVTMAFVLGVGLWAGIGTQVWLSRPQPAEIAVDPGLPADLPQVVNAPLDRTD